MDKETLSNYGWIVICVLVLAVMLALASPFGNFVANAIKSTAQGLFDVNLNALDAAGIEMKEQEFDTMLNGNTAKYKFCDMVEQGDYRYTFMGNCNSYEEFKTSYFTYMLFFETGNKYTYDEALEVFAQANFGTSWAEAQTNGITEEQVMSWIGLTQETYEGAKGSFVNGWDVCAISKTKSTYQDIPAYIDGYPVFTMSATFQDCTALITAPAIPETVTDMSDTFMGCTNLTSVTIPTTVKNIYSNVFRDCVNLSNVVIPNPNTMVYCNAFDGSGINSVTLPENLPMVDSHLFNDCVNLVSITIPKNVTSIEFSAFRDCTSLTSIVIPADVTKIGDHAFCGCASLGTIIFEGTMNEWNSIEFGYQWNVRLLATQVQCSDGTVSLS